MSSCLDRTRGLSGNVEAATKPDCWDGAAQWLYETHWIPEAHTACQVAQDPQVVADLSADGNDARASVIAVSLRPHD